jgi:hypothetical protein
VAEFNPDGSVVDDEAAAAEAALQQKFTAANEQVVRARVLAEMMGDPDFAAVARAKAAGQKFVVQVDGQQGQQAEADPDLTEEDLSNPTKLKGFLLKSLDGIVKNAFKQQMEPKFQAIDQFIGNQQTRDAQSQVAQARQEFPDFDSYLTEMQQLNLKHPTMDAKELYHLARSQKGLAPVNPSRAASERPSSSIARPQGVGRQLQQQQKPLGLRAALRSAAEQHATNVPEY